MEPVADLMLRQIEQLLETQEPSLDALETTLHDGYAQALALEAERTRLERRLGEIARTGDAEPGETISSIGRQLNVADDELAKLRPLLETLQERTRTVRAGSYSSR